MQAASFSASPSNGTSGCLKSVQIALLLLTELKLGFQSALHAWIQSLPQQFSTLMHWNRHELEELQMNSTSIERAFLFQGMPLRLSKS